MKKATKKGIDASDRVKMGSVPSAKESAALGQTPFNIIHREIDALGQTLFFNIILAAGFILVVFVIVTPLLAQTRFDAAEKLFGKSKWPAAEARFEAAMRIDPFNTEYPARYGLFLLNKAKYADNKTPLYKRSGELYSRALELCPGSAESRARLGQAYVGLGIEEKSTVYGLRSTVYGPQYMNKGFECFEKAVERDPNGFNVNYIAGFTGAQVWELLDERKREFVAARLKKSLKERPWLLHKIYRILWSKAKDFKLLQRLTPEDLRSNEGLYNFVIANDLWQFRKAQADAVTYYSSKEKSREFEDARSRVFKIIESLKKDASSGKKTGSTLLWQKVDGKWEISNTAEQAISKEEALGSRRQSGIIFPEDWQVFPEKGGAIIRPNGNMYWNSTMYAPVNAPKGTASVRVRAMGTPAKGAYPYMIVALDGEDIGETYVDGPEWKEYRFDVNTKGGVVVLSVTYVNDLVNAAKKEDRNLYIDQTSIAKDEEKNL